MRWLAPVIVAACGRFDFDPHDSGFDFPDFTTCPSTLVFTGVARCLVGDDLKITDDIADEAGQVWFATPYAMTRVTRFALAVRFRFSPSMPPGADGATVVISGDPRGTAAIGVGAGAFGYGMITPSAALELDTFQNTTNGDPNANHLGIDRDGSVTSVVAMSAAPIVLADSTAFSVWFDYDGPTSTLAGYVAKTTTKPAQPLVTTTDDLTRLGDHVWLGITAATGNRSELHDVLAWSLAVTP